MTEETHEYRDRPGKYQEQVLWDSPTDGTLISIVKAPMYNDKGEVAGYTTENREIKITFDELNANLRLHQDSLKRILQQKDDMAKKINALKQRQNADHLETKMTPTLIKVKKQLESIQTISEITNLENSFSKILDQESESREYIEARIVSLEKRPKPE